jgi:rod shape-determining protein MreD
VSYYLGLALVFVFAIAEASVLPFFRVAGLQPNLTLVLLVAWLGARGREEVLVLVPAAGIFIGLVDGSPLGAALLAFSPLLLLHELSGSRLRHGGLLMASLLMILMTLVLHSVYLLTFTLSGEAGSWSVAFTEVVIPTALLNVVVLLPLYALVSVASQEHRRAAYA